MIALDIETTGLEATKNCMISLGAVRIESDEEFYEECRKFKGSEWEVSEKALEVNGFTYQEIIDRNKPFPDETYKNFVDWYNRVKQSDIELLIGQNLPSFDIKFLKYYHYDVLGNEFKWPFGHRYLDLHTYVYAKTGKSQSHDDTLRMLGLEPEEKPHNALNGAKVVKEIYKRI